MAGSHVVFALHGHVLLTIVEVNPGKKASTLENKIRVVLRNPAGKFVWDFENFYTAPGEITTKIISSPMRYDPNLYSGGSRKVSRNVKTESVVDVNTSEYMVRDCLETLMINIEAQNPECSYNSNPAYEILESYYKQLQFHIPVHTEAEMEIHGDFDINNITGKASLKITKFQKLGPHSKPAIFQNARLFLAQMGQLSFDYLKDGNVHMLGKSPALLRDIRGIDKKHT